MLADLCSFLFVLWDFSILVSGNPKRSEILSFGFWDIYGVSLQKRSFCLEYNFELTWSNHCRLSFPSDLLRSDRIYLFILFKKLVQFWVFSNIYRICIFFSPLSNSIMVLLNWLKFMIFNVIFYRNDIDMCVGYMCAGLEWRPFYSHLSQ